MKNLVMITSILNPPRKPLTGFVELRYDDSYEMAGYQITDYRTEIFKNAEIQQRTDMFSQACGKKFYIPFFDDAESIGGEEHIVPQGAPPNPVDPTEMK